MNRRIHLALLLWATLLLPACTTTLPDEPAPLPDMEEPLALFAEPDDEAARQALPTGGFTGAYVADARQTLEAMLGDAAGIEVARIVENSPADIAGLAVGDLLLEARLGDAPPRALGFPSDWRAVELACGADTPLTVVFDRANRRTSTTLHTVPRLRAPDRDAPLRVREEERIGVVVRGATEVEARSAGLAPGAGAVVVGLSRSSPWRGAGLRFGDLLTALDGQAIAHPSLVVPAIRGAGDTIRVDFVRDGAPQSIATPTGYRPRDVTEFSIPLVIDHESNRGHSETSVLLGLVHYEETRAAWRLRLLWLIRIGGGDAEELLEVDR